MKEKKFLVLICGFPGVGKLTIAKELSKTAPFELIHNHIVIDTINNILPPSPQRSLAKELMQLSLISKLSKHNNTIVTHAYSYTFKSKTGTTDNQFVKNIKKIANKNKSIFIPVYIFCQEKEILKRIQNSSRKKFGKMIKTSDMEELLKKEDSKRFLKINNSIYIDSTNINPKDSAKIILNKIKGIQTN